MRANSKESGSYVFVKGLNPESLRRSTVSSGTGGNFELPKCDGVEISDRQSSLGLLAAGGFEFDS